MITESIKSLFTRDLNQLKKEIEAYQNEEAIWKIDKKILNSAGNLSLHLVGNINHFIGSILGHSGYVRNRELEFSLKNVPRTELVEKIEKTIEVVHSSLDQLSEEDIRLKL
nr:DUF1572 family protein [Chryseobacterium mulctrae]